MNFKKDNFFFGALLGLAFPIILFCFGKFLQNQIEFSFKESTMYAISCIINLPIFRLFMISFDKDKIGRGILFSTFLHVFYYLFEYM